MLRHPTAKHIARVLNDWVYRFEPIARTARRSRKIYYQGPSAHASDAASERRARKVGERDHTDSLGNSFRFTLDHRASRLGRYVALRQTRPAGRNHQLGVVHVGGANE